MRITKRLRSAIQRGPHTLAVTISHSVRDKLEIQKGDPLVVYELGPVMLVYPLHKMSEIRAYQLVKVLEEALSQQVH